MSLLGGLSNKWLSKRLSKTADDKSHGTTLPLIEYPRQSMSRHMNEGQDFPIDTIGLARINATAIQGSDSDLPLPLFHAF